MEENKKEKNDNIDDLFVKDVLAEFKATETEILERNQTIEKNDGFIYGESITKRIKVPIGHDFTPINWLRRTVEIHRSQFIGKGFSFDSSYTALDVNVDDKQEKQRRTIENEKRKSYAELRRTLCKSINNDNGGDSFWSAVAENASAVGTTVVKGWYDKKNKIYKLQNVERIENIYAIWSEDDFRTLETIAYIYQISPSKAKRLYGVDDDVQLSPLGSPLTPFGSSTEAKSSGKAMVTVMEVTGIIPGYKSVGGVIMECPKGKEKPLNAVIVGDDIYQVIDKEDEMPKYYVFPNKLARRRAWGISDITDTAIQINLTYIETFSDWRTVSSKVNFPKFKAFGFPRGVQPPKPTARTVEFLPLSEGQDIVQIQMDKNEADFKAQLEEMQDQFVREVGISRTLFDMPDANGNSNPALLTAMKSVSDITNAKRNLWSPIISQVFEDALRAIAESESDIKELIDDEEDWAVKVSFPSAMNADDPSYNSTQLNMFNTGVLSLQTLLENLGYDKQEIDRIRSEMEDPLTAAIHGRQLPMMASALIAPPQPNEPKISVNLRGDLTPEQEANLAYQKGMNQGPFGTTAGPQGNQGMTAQANESNEGYIEGGKQTGGTSISRNADGSMAQESGAGVTPPLMNGPNTNQEGVGIMSQPGSGAPAVTPEGALAQTNQQVGA